MDRPEKMRFESVFLECVALLCCQNIAYSLLDIPTALGLEGAALRCISNTSLAKISE